VTFQLSPSILTVLEQQLPLLSLGVDVAKMGWIPALVKERTRLETQKEAWICKLSMKDLLKKVIHPDWFFLGVDG
jgi:hypothetical protein